MPGSRYWMTDLDKMMEVLRTSAPGVLEPGDARIIAYTAGITDLEAEITTLEKYMVDVCEARTAGWPKLIVKDLIGRRDFYIERFMMEVDLRLFPDVADAIHKHAISRQQERLAEMSPGQQIEIGGYS